MFAIKKRLGGTAYEKISGMMNHAFALHLKGHDALQQQAHKDWIEQLLCRYYDPMYEYQINKKTQRIVASGDRKSLRQYLQATQESSSRC
jgi:tRNA 2-selenouridine synthase